jgi:hypothetical protein
MPNVLNDWSDAPSGHSPVFSQVLSIQKNFGRNRVNVPSKSFMTQLRGQARRCNAPGQGVE